MAALLNMAIIEHLDYLKRSQYPPWVKDIFIPNSINLFDLIKVVCLIQKGIQSALYSDDILTYEKIYLVTQNIDE